MRGQSQGPIPVIEIYRGVGIHDQQPRERIEKVVKPEVDRVFAMDDITALAEFAGEPMNCPEARLLAAAKVEALWQLAVEDRRVRPAAVDLDDIRASVAGLDSQYWRSPWRYTCLLDPGPAVEREVALPE